MVSTHPLVGILTGPTASGKTALSLHLSSLQPQLEIINADSLLFYKELAIGTAKPTPRELASVTHHLIGTHQLDQPFSAADFYRAAQTLITEITARGKRALIVGGSGFYLKALLFGLWEAPASDPQVRARLSHLSLTELHQQLLVQDPESAQSIGAHDRYRLVRALEIIELCGKTPTQLKALMPTHPDPRFALWVIDRSNADLHQRIASRTSQMLENGLIAEYQTFQDQYPGAAGLKSVGYLQVAQCLGSGLTLSPAQMTDKLNESIALATRQLVKRQRTWFRNQLAKIPQSQQFLLDAQGQQLEEAFKKVYNLPT